MVPPKYTLFESISKVFGIFVKYPFSSQSAGKKAKFGFFLSEEEDYRKIASTLGIKRLSKEGEPLRYARHPLVYLVEAADDTVCMVPGIAEIVGSRYRCSGCGGHRAGNGSRQSDS